MRRSSPKMRPWNSRVSFLVDMALSPNLATWLRSQGHDATHASELSLDRAADTQILSTGVDLDRIVITADLDFPRLLAALGAYAPSLILLRGGNYSESESVECGRRVLMALRHETCRNALPSAPAAARRSYRRSTQECKGEPLWTPVALALRVPRKALGPSFIFPRSIFADRPPTRLCPRLPSTEPGLSPVAGKFLFEFSLCAASVFTVSMKAWRGHRVCARLETRFPCSSWIGSAVS